MDKLNNRLKNCCWNENEILESWEKMYPLAEDGSLQWISSDIGNKTSELNLLACLSCGCSVRGKNKCKLKKIDIGVLVKNRMVPMNRRVYILIRVEILAPKKKLHCDIDSMLFELTPTIGRDSYVNSRRIALTDLALCKGLDVIIKIFILRDLTPDFQHIKKISGKKNWSLINSDELSDIIMSTHIN